MPRLIGKKRSHLPSAIVVFLMGLVIGGGVVGEYAGLFDYIPRFGATNPQEQVLLKQSD